MTFRTKTKRIVVRVDLVFPLAQWITLIGSWVVDHAAETSKAAREGS